MANKTVSQNQILETLHLQPISQEEMTQRHILGRLYGPIATFGDSTRNGRFYNKDLWTKALSDDIFLEKVANKSLFLELEHPTDRDQIDMKQACACIPQVPKIIGNDLYAVIDILDTPNGRILKTLVDYGFRPGISSRGSGDVNANDEVDPETFYLETWDVVSLPAVKKARLNVCESYDGKKSLKHALKEALEKSSEEDQKIMKNTLNNMNIDVEENLTEASGHARLLPTPANIEDIPEIFDDEFDVYDDVLENLEEDVEEDSEIEDEVAEETPEEEVESEEVESEEVAEEVASDVLTVKDIIAQYKDFDDDTVVEFAPVEIAGVEYNTQVSIVDQDEEGKKIVLGVECTPVESTEDKEADNSDDEEVADEVIDETEEAVDDGDEEVVESFKDLVRQKDLLESEVKSLKNAQSVSDAKVQELEESLNKYKTAFARTSELAARAKKLKTMNESLNAKLSENTQEIAELKSRVKNSTSLNESINSNAAKVKTLTEKLQTMQKDFTESKTKLEEQVAQSNKKLSERTELAKKYKASYLNVIEHYVVSKAKMLGVKPVEITSKLNESYTIEDIDNVCDQILTESVGINRLPFGNNRKATVKINESKQSSKAVSSNPDDSFDLDSLIEFAGL